MPVQAIIDKQITTSIAATDETNFHILCSFEGVIINNPPQIISPIFVDVDQDSEYNFLSTIITDNFSDIEGDSLLHFKVIETVDVGELLLGTSNILIENGQVIEWSNFTDLKWKPLSNQFGANYTSLKLVFKDDGEIPRCWSNIVEIIFNVIPENQEPTVSDNQLKVDYKDRIALTADLFTKNYYDPETNAFGGIIIYNLPPAGEGRILLNNILITSVDLPLTVQASDIISNLLEYQDTGEIIQGKDFNITFEVLDNII